MTNAELENDLAEARRARQRLKEHILALFVEVVTKQREVALLTDLIRSLDPKDQSRAY